MAKVSVNLVVYNGAKYIPFLFDSLKKQTFKDWEMIIVDNASTDNTVALLEKELADGTIHFRLFKNKENIGFSAGHNLAFLETKAPYILMQNVDMYLTANVLERMVSFMDAHTDTAAIAPRLMRWDFTSLSTGVTLEQSFTNQIDAIGIRLFRNRRAVEWLTKEEWVSDSSNKFVRDLYNKKVCEVFGVSGALPMYRKSILDKALLLGKDLFDRTYHSYKEDLDLAYRLRNAGHLSYVLLDVVAYHDRTGAGPKEMGDRAAIANKKFQSKFVVFHSYKNHLRTLYKNEYWQNVLLDWPFIFWYEFKKFGFFLVTNPKVIFQGWYEIIRNWSYTKAAKRSVVESRKMYWRGIRRWFL